VVLISVPQAVLWLDALGVGRCHFGWVRRRTWFIRSRALHEVHDIEDLFRLDLYRSRLDRRNGRQRILAASLHGSRAWADQARDHCTI
jgi:hypothetical protein